MQFQLLILDIALEAIVVLVLPAIVENDTQSHRNFKVEDVQDIGFNGSANANSSFNIN